jgi:hypothetical protein
VNWFRLKTCIKCQGDLAADHGDWLCLQCGTYYYTGLYQLPSHTNDSPPPQGPTASPEPNERSLAAGIVPSFTTSETAANRALSAIGAAVESL